MMLLLNYAHPLTAPQQSQLEAMLGRQLERTIAVQAQFDVRQPFAHQAQSLMAQTGLTAQEWQTLPMIINLPSFNTIAALLLAEIHGRTGYFPAILRLRPVAEALPPQFEIAEILNLQAIRDQARQERSGESA